MTTPPIERLRKLHEQDCNCMCTCSECNLPETPCDTVAALDALEAERDELRARVNADAPYSSMMAATDRWQRRAIALQARLDAATELIRQGWLSLHRYHAMTEEAWLTTLQTCEFCAPFRAWLEGEGQ